MRHRRGDRSGGRRDGGRISVVATARRLAFVRTGRSRIRRRSKRRRLLRCRIELLVVKRGVETVERQQVDMTAPLHDPSMIHHQDQIGGEHGRNPVRDHDRGPAMRELQHRLLNGMFQA